jgi:hypothetical protein
MQMPKYSLYSDDRQRSGLGAISDYIPPSWGTKLLGRAAWMRDMLMLLTWCPERYSFYFLHTHTGTGAQLSMAWLLKNWLVLKCLWITGTQRGSIEGVLGGIRFPECVADADPSKHLWHPSSHRCLMQKPISTTNKHFIMNEGMEHKEFVASWFVPGEYQK